MSHISHINLIFTLTVSMTWSPDLQIQMVDWNGYPPNLINFNTHIAREEKREQGKKKEKRGKKGGKTERETEGGGQKKEWKVRQCYYKISTSHY